MPKIGSWKDCELKKAHKRVKLKYWRVWDSPYNFCGLCLDAIQKENKTGKYSISRVPMLNAPKSRPTPEKDSL